MSESWIRVEALRFSWEEYSREKKLGFMDYEEMSYGDVGLRLILSLAISLMTNDDITVHMARKYIYGHGTWKGIKEFALLEERKLRSGRRVIYEKPINSTMSSNQIVLKPNYATLTLL